MKDLMKKGATKYSIAHEPHALGDWVRGVSAPTHGEDHAHWTRKRNKCEITTIELLPDATTYRNVLNCRETDCGSISVAGMFGDELADKIADAIPAFVAQVFGQVPQ